MFFLLINFIYFTDAAAALVYLKLSTAIARLRILDCSESVTEVIPRVRRIILNELFNFE